MSFGEVNVDALARKLTAKQFLGWEAYASLEPFGERRADYRTAQILRMLLLVNTAAEDRNKVPSLEDLLLAFEEKKPKVPQSFQEQIAIAKIMANAAAAGAVNKGR